MSTRILALALGALLAGPATGSETRFSAMVSDIETGLILTADRIDSPRDTAVMGHLSTIALALQDLADGNLDAEETISAGRVYSASVTESLHSIAGGYDDKRAAMTALVNRVGQNARIFKTRLDEVAELSGLQATSLEIVRADDGGPAFAGYTTVRDISRLATSMLRAFPVTTANVFSAATMADGMAAVWIYDEGVCVLSAAGPVTGRQLLAVLTGAPGETECHETAMAMIGRDDARVSGARMTRAGR